MAISAFCSNSSAFSASSGYNAIPILDDTLTMWLSSCTGVSIMLIIWLAKWVRPSMLCTCSISTTNSSPPRRAMVSSLRKRLSNRADISCSRVSPALCPKLSLTCLNLSKSIKNNPRVWVPLCAWSMAWFTRSSNSVLLGNPVNESKLASFINACWAFLCSLMSLKMIKYESMSVTSLMLATALM